MELKTTNIHGKDYVEVNERIKAFRTSANYIGYSLSTDIVELTPDYCTFNAIIKDKDGRVVATGLAHEEKSASTINKTSYIENCETSAWGRALGNLGIGVDSAICSAFELQCALAAQGEEKPQTSNPSKQPAKVAQKAEKQPQKEPAKVSASAQQTLTEEQKTFIGNCVACFKANPQYAVIAKTAVGKAGSWSYEDYVTAANAVNAAIEESNKNNNNGK